MLATVEEYAAKPSTNSEQNKYWKNAWFRSLHIHPLVVQSPAPNCKDVQGAVDKIYDKYPEEKKNMPHWHPIVQLVGNELNASFRSKHVLSWSELTTAAVCQLCQQSWMASRCQHRIPWHLLYFRVPPNGLCWWNVPQGATLSDDGLHTIILCSLSIN